MDLMFVGADSLYMKYEAEFHEKMECMMLKFT